MAAPQRPFDEVLLSQARLGVISVLVARGEASFADLKSLLGLTQGNLGSHLQSLEDSGYVLLRKEFVDRKPHTTARITVRGRRAFLDHVARLSEIARNGG